MRRRDLKIEERRLIQELLGIKLSCAKISKIIFRSNTCVVYEVRRNGGRELYDADKAQLAAENRDREKVEKIKNSLIDQPFNPYVHLKSKIENLEMHMEIIIELLKEKK